jgi:hypothetical protein
MSFHIHIFQQELKIYYRNKTFEQIDLFDIIKISLIYPLMRFHVPLI